MPHSTVLKLLSKSLTDTDTNKRLAIPTKILPLLPNFKGSHAVEFQLIYGIKKWPIVCSFRRKGYKKPVCSHGWTNFVVCNDLNVIDQVTLYRVRDEVGSIVYYMMDVERPAYRIPSDQALSTSPSDFDNGTTSTSFNFKDHNQLRHQGPDAPVEAPMDLGLTFALPSYS